MYITNVYIKRLREDAEIPAYAHGFTEDAGFDLRAIEQVVLRRGVPTPVPTGLAIALAPGYEAQIRPRSGLAAKHGITIMNSPGTVDPSYRGEITVVLIWNGHNPNCHSRAGEPAYAVNKGDRIAQMVVAPYSGVVFEDVAELPDSNRGSGGFGSTGY